MAEAFVSAVRENLGGRSEALAVELFAGGPSTRDIEAAFTNTDGRRLVTGSPSPEPSRAGRVRPVCRWHCERLGVGCRASRSSPLGDRAEWAQGLAPSHYWLEEGHEPVRAFFLRA